MSSRRRNSKKNLGTNLSDIQRRLRRMERKPIRTRLQNRVIKGAAIAPSSITADEVEFGTTVITNENPADVILNPKEGLLVVDPDTGEGKSYSEQEGDYVDIKDATARSAAATAASNAATAQSNATTALANAATALTAANNSLQPSASTIVNASNQMTAINSTGITVYSGASATSGARIVLNSTGFAGFNSGGTATFSISATTGAAVFSGSVTGSTITASTMNIGGNAIIDATGILTATGAIITGTINATAGYFGTVSNGFSISSTGLVGVGAGTIVGGTITGSTVRTAGSGRRVEVDSSNNALSFYNAAGTALGHIRPADDYSGVVISSGGSATTSFASSSYPKMLMYPSGNDGQFTLILDSSNGGLSFSSSSGVYSATIGATNTAAVNPYGQRSLREIGLGSATTYPDLSSVVAGITGQEGFIVLTYS